MLSVISQPEYSLTETDLEILEVLNALSFVTAEQLSRVLYNGADHNRYSQRRLKRLVDGGYVRRFRTLSEPFQGSAPHVFTLTNPGRRTLSAWGIAPSQPYLRPSEQKTAALNQPFLKHTLSCGDVLAAALRLTRNDANITLERMLSERELRRKAPRVTLPGGTVTAVIPDAFLVFKLAQDPPIAIAFEVDRGTEHQRPWRAKVGALAAWVRGTYQQSLGLDNLTIAVAAPSQQRLEQLKAWTHRELEQQGALALADIVLFSATSPRDVPATTWFFTPIWQPLDQSRPVSLLDYEGGAVP